MPKCLLVACWLICVTAPLSFAQSRPATRVAALEELGSVPYAGFRLLRVRLSLDGTRALLNHDQPAAQRDVVAVYEVATGKQLLKREATRADTLSYVGDSISSDGKHIAISAMDKKARSTASAVSVDTQETLWQMNTGPGDVAFFADNTAALVIFLPSDVPSGTRRLIAADVARGKPLWQFDTREVEIGRATLSMNGKRLLASVDKEGPDPQCILDLAAKKKLPDLENSSIRRLSDTTAFLADTTDVVGLVAEHLVKWDSTTGRLQEIAKLGPFHRDAQTEFSPDGKRLYVLSGNRLVVYNSNTGATIHDLPVLLGTELKSVSNTGVVAIRVLASLRFVRVSTDADLNN